jgi:hypothetical protein
MNPLGLLIIGIGLVCFIIGFKGSQHEVISAFKGGKGGAGEGVAGPAKQPTVGIA